MDMFALLINWNVVYMEVVVQDFKMSAFNCLVCSKGRRLNEG